MGRWFFPEALPVPVALQPVSELFTWLLSATHRLSHFLLLSNYLTPACHFTKRPWPDNHQSLTDL